MNAKRGYFSLVQFCPNPSRAEAVNLGVMLFCPEADFIAARMAVGNRAAAKLVGREGVDSAALNAAKRAIEHRLRVDRASFQTLDDFQQFVDTRANVLKLTSPRPLKVVEPEAELNGLFEELVGGRARRARKSLVFPQLDDLFSRLKQQGRARLDQTVTIPIFETPLHIPYIYPNGDLNLVKPQRFSNQESHAVKVAGHLAMKGDLLLRHGEDREGKKHLVIVTSFEPSGDGQVVRSRVNDILQEYKVKTIAEDHIAEFIAQIEQEAHSFTGGGDFDNT